MGTNTKTAPEIWAAAKAHYITTNATYEDVSSMYGIGLEAVGKRGTREGWRQLRQNHVDAMAARAAENQAERTANELVRFNDGDLIVAKAIRKKAADMLRLADTPGKLRALALAMESAQKIGRLALGATTNNTGHSDPAGGPVQVASASLLDGIDLEKLTPQQLEQLETALQVLDGLGTGPGDSGAEEP